MWESLVFIPLLVVTFVPETFQACTRPSTGDNVVLSAELDSYYDYYYLQISCDDGYTQSGTAYSYCYPSTGWDPDPSLVECQASCSLPKVDSDVTVEPEETTYSIGEKVTFSCTSGTLTGSFEGTCGSNATWIIETNPSCLGCLPPTVPTNVTYAPEESTYDENSRIELSCEGETTPFGPEYSYCNSSKEWEPSPLLLNCYDKCEVPSFSDSDVIVTSDFTGSSDESYYDHTDTVRFSCAGGLFVDGPWKASCRNGAWSTNFGGDSPTCRANCTAPSNTLIDGQTFRHGHGEAIECVDEPGMVRLGGPMAFCIDGSWKPNVLCKYKTEL